jgi:hypothetical protein
VLLICSSVGSSSNNNAINNSNSIIINNNGTTTTTTANTSALINSTTTTTTTTNTNITTSTSIPSPGLTHSSSGLSVVRKKLAARKKGWAQFLKKVDDPSRVERNATLKDLIRREGIPPEHRGKV